MTSRLSHYLIEETIGAGSFSSVHRAVDERLGDTVAIKILAENHSLNPEIRERFIAEGRALRRVGGHGVPAVYDIGESDRQQPYLVLEHADGGSLRVRVEALRAGGWRAERHDLLALARPLAAGIADVHRARIVHRDLSPGNLLLASRASSGEETGLGSHLVRDDERLLISDLGMCKDLALNSGLTVAGGTSGFRPPEQNAPGTVDTRADIWAISALMSWAAEGATLPAELTRVLARGQANRPARRQPDAGTWLREVEAALAPPEPAPVAPQPAPPARSTKRRRILAGSAALVALVCGLVIGLWIGHDPALPSAASGASISISGPTEISVGEEAVFTASVDGVDSWSWALPSHQFVADQAEVTVTPTSAGTGEIVLRSLAGDGTELEARRTVRVVE
ncbi:MAG: serine/threonine-protein kinase [Microbacterium gubbeenense]|uniref:serine/threonine-protein kinase n=1 Tax=Microbacterium gubbeenense TaxID=159896 RepID=UPI00041C6D3C|nr:serine/threonine-protein kinase [Microbacterium gubbeenense]